MTANSKLWLVYSGAAFNLWQPDTGKHPKRADPDEVTGHLQRKRLNQHDTKSSAFSLLPYEVIAGRFDAALPPPRASPSATSLGQVTRVRSSLRSCPARWC